MNFEFVIQSLMVGVGLAMDSCAVSMTDGMNEKNMPFGKNILVALLFAIFQQIMPILGYFIGQIFSDFIHKYIPIIALLILGVLGVKMLADAIKNKNETEKFEKITIPMLILQAIATSIDALSVGVTFVSYPIKNMLFVTSLIGIITFFFTFCGVKLGKHFGTIFGKDAQIVGGLILILNGMEIYISSLF
jgi:manganese efflux pump family protein